MEIAWLISGVFLGGAIAWIMFQSGSIGKTKSQQKTISEYSTRLTLAEERKTMLEQQIIALKPELAKERQKAIDLSNELVKTKTEYTNLEGRLTEQRKEVEQLNKRFALEFRNLAQEIFEEKSRKFTNQNKENLGELLSPLKEKIGQFEKKVEDSNKEGAARNAALIQQIKHLSDLNKQITREAENLTKALKGDSKTQGNWGEVVLERILEKSGLRKGSEYEVQVSAQGEDGKRYQPDVVVKLPDNKNLVIDAKVSLVAYERFANGESDEDQKAQLKMHITSLRSHVKGLSEKSYQNLYGIDGLDFVLLFVPIEPAFTLAVQHDPELFNDAYSNNIVIVSPTTLIATLRTIASIWKQEYQNKNALEIARQSGALYDKFAAFTEDLIKVGDNLNTTKKNYDQAMNKLSEGRDNLIRKTEKIKQLGAKVKKQVDQSLLDHNSQN